MKFYTRFFLVLSGIALLSCSREEKSLEFKVVEQAKFEGTAIADPEANAIGKGLHELFGKFDSANKMDIADTILSRIRFKDHFNANTNSLKVSMSNGFLEDKAISGIDVSIKRDLAKFTRNGFGILYAPNSIGQYEFVKNSNAGAVIRVDNAVLTLDTTDYWFYDKNHTSRSSIRGIDRFDSKGHYLMSYSVRYKDKKTEERKITYSSDTHDLSSNTICRLKGEHAAPASKKQNLEIQ